MTFYFNHGNMIARKESELKDKSVALFNNSWKFTLGDAKDFHEENFCDCAWKNVDLPHDWVISRPFNRGEEGGWTPQNMQGFFVWEGVCWYRKEFSLSCVEGRAVFVYFGGAYRNSKVYVNGKEAGGRAFGYASFEIDITEFVKEGKNLIAVRLDNGCEPPDRWYSGSGLYRNVLLKILPATHIKTWGVHVDAKKNDVTVTTTVVSRDKSAKGNAHLQIYKPGGSLAAKNTLPFDMNGKSEITVKQKISIKNPALWSSENPNLYSADVSLETGKEKTSEKVNFGFRTVKIEYKKGMTVNGQKVKLKGVCLHHDCGITGAAYYDEAWRRRLLTLKSLGCNAVRTSHNPPAREFLDLCDELGFYVVDECFDKWKSGYFEAHFDKESERELVDFIIRDRNHPCVIIWSVGNEVEKQGEDGMLAIQKTLVGIVKTLDDRPVTCALAPHANPRSLVGAPAGELVKLTKKLAKDVDVLGLNYHEPLYQAYTAEINKPILGTECYEYYSSVGTNFEDVCKKNPWRFVQENDNVIGQFIWAGIDYLGESPWPAKGWTGSILDICGFMKPNAFFRKSLWSCEPFVYLAFYDQQRKPDYARGRWSFPPMASHLNFDHFHRKNVTAAVFTNCEETELRVNGKKMGRRKGADFENGIIEWPLEYHEGNMEVKGFIKGKEVCSYTLKTAEKPQKIKLLPDKTKLKAGEIAHIEVNVTDKNGLLYPNGEFFVEFAFEGDARFLGACSGDLTQNLGFAFPKVFTFDGRALAMIRAGNSSGGFVLRAYSEMLENAELRFNVEGE